MKLIRNYISFNDRIVAAKVRATFKEMQSLMEQPSRPLRLDNEENCLFTYAKAYYKGYGIWMLSGYSQDDVRRVLERAGTCNK